MSMSKFQTNLSNLAQNSTPVFSENEPFEKFIKGFRIYMRRDEKCNLVFNNVKGIPIITRNFGEKKDLFRSRSKKVEIQRSQWAAGNATIFSYLYQAIMQQNVRAANVISSLSGEGDGIAAIEALEIEFKDQSIIREDGQQLKLKYENRKILPGESITSFIEDIGRIRLQLKELNVTLSDEDIVTKILHSMATTENQAYAGIRDSIIASEDPTIGITLSLLTQKLRKIDSIRAGTMSTSSPIQSNTISSVQTNPQPAVESVNAVFNQKFRKFRKQKPNTFKNFQRSKSSLSQRSGKTGRAIKCFRCQGKNHTAAECRTDWRKIKPRESNHSKQPRQQHQRNFREDEGEVSEESINMVSEEDVQPSQYFGILDSGATSHISSSLSMMEDLRIHQGQFLLANTKDHMSFTHIGNAGEFSDVLYCPDAKFFIISVAKLMEENYEISFSQKGVIITKAGVIITVAKRDKNLFLVNLSDFGINPQESCSLASYNPPQTLLAAHQRLGHASLGLIKKAIKGNLLTGVTISSTEEITCFDCLKGKAHRRKNREEIREMIPEKLKRPQNFGEVIYVDSSGPFKIPSIVENSKHLLIFIDAASGYIFDFYFDTVNSTNVLNSLKEVTAFIGSLGAKLSHYHADGAMNLLAKEILDFLTKSTVTYSYNSPYTAEDNSYAERSFRTIKECSLSQLIASGLPANFWSKSCEHFIHTHNRLPRQTAKGFISPYQFIHNEIPNLSYTRVWGSKVVFQIDRSLRANDWSARGSFGYFMGYRRKGAGYIIYVPKLEKFIESGHVFFTDQLFSQSSFIEEDLFVPQSLHNISKIIPIL